MGQRESQAPTSESKTKASLRSCGTQQIFYLGKPGHRRLHAARNEDRRWSASFHSAGRDGEHVSIHAMSFLNGRICHDSCQVNPRVSIPSRRTCGSASSFAKHLAWMHATPRARTSARPQHVLALRTPAVRSPES